MLFRSVAGWGAVSEESRDRGGEPVWDLMSRYLRAQKTVRALRLNLPRLKGVAGDPGIDPATMRAVELC